MLVYIILKNIFNINNINAGFQHLRYSPSTLVPLLELAPAIQCCCEHIPESFPTLPAFHSCSFSSIPSTWVQRHSQRNLDAAEKPGGNTSTLWQRQRWCTSTWTWASTQVFQQCLRTVIFPCEANRSVTTPRCSWMVNVSDVDAPGIANVQTGEPGRDRCIKLSRWGLEEWPDLKL